MNHDADKTEPNTIAALARELAAFEKRQEARTQLVLNEMRRHGTALGEHGEAIEKQTEALAGLAKTVADLNLRVDRHDRWERAGRDSADADLGANGDSE